MAREYFLQTSRLKFSTWNNDDLELAKRLWGNSQVTKYISATGSFDLSDIINRLDLEITSNQRNHVQYWPVFELESENFIGCCGLRKIDSNGYELGFHLLPDFWHHGYGYEAAKAIIKYAANILKAKYLMAGHNPDNLASKKLLNKLGFIYDHDEYYKPTGLQHPTYYLQLNN